MHELGRYLQREMDRRGWKTSDLVRRSGLSKQTVYNLINDTRQFMDQTPQRKTVNGLAEALGVDPIEILTASAQALGVPIEGKPASAGLGGISSEQILHELSLRLAGARSEHDDPKRAEANPSGERVDGEGGRRGGVGSGEKTGLSFAPIVQSQTDEHDDDAPPADLLAAHPNFKTDRERFDEAHGAAGEEDQSDQH
ncbi:helix-turn-helix domain-containing protein [Arthrobacter rhombi]|uniref:helix-turn-helix domain-containing protein n=1 Tax=Arthrobacter rhombi TaxID=71253 RepID=UPI003FD42E8D